MVGRRCQADVKVILEQLKLPYVFVGAGVVELATDMQPERKDELRDALAAKGLEPVYGKRNLLIDRIKHAICHLINYFDEPLSINFSHYLSAKLGYNYTYLANLFSDIQGITIEKFVIINKIEKAKELLTRSQLNLTEIAYRLHYSSVSHLSSQFKKVTGVSPSSFKTNGRQEVEPSSTNLLHKSDCAE
jgi:AraC-like DNA-binding protein